MKQITENIVVDFTPVVNEETGRKEWKYSFNNGQSWKTKGFYNSDESAMISHLIGEYRVQKILKPTLQKGESLCRLCMNKGEVGIAKYAGIVGGTETQTVVRYNGDYEWTEDQSFYCEYEQWKCQRCGDVAWSDYA